MFDALDLAKYIVTKCINDGHPISNLQLQKILFYIQKDYLMRNRVAFADNIEAWQFGPVVPNVYYRFCGFGAMPITSSHTAISMAVEDSEIIDRIVEEKRALDPWELVEETHKKNGAWDLVYQNGNGNHEIISLDLIKKAG